MECFVGKKSDLDGCLCYPDVALKLLKETSDNQLSKIVGIDTATVTNM
jgi:hypothetical protein